ncbi:MAG: POTRA domain-containing protein, partial [bacterium]
MDFGLKKILVFFLFLILSICDNLLIPAYGQSLQITAFNLKCSGQTRCATYNDHFRELIGEYTSIQHFTTSFLLFSDEEDFAKLGYEVIESKDGNHVLQIYLDLNPLISKLDIYVHGDDSWLIENNLPLQEGDIFEVDQLSKMRKELSRQLKDGSYFNFDIDINRKSTDLKQAYVTANIVPGKKTMVRNISIKSENSEIRKLIYRQLISYMHAPFNIVEFKQRLEDLETFLFNQGYYFTELAYDGFERIDQYNVNLKINVLGEEQYFFYFHGNETFDRSSLLTYMKQQLQKYNKDIATSAMAEILEEFYSTHAFHQAKIEVKERYRDQIYPGKRYYITIEENKRSTIQKIEFLGNVAFSDSHLKDVYDDNASSLANSGYFDQEYVELFSEQLQKFYIENGFLFAKISEPNIKKNDSNILIQYSIVEGSKTYVGNINLEGIPKEALDAVREVLDFKSEQIFNPYLIDENIAKVNKLLKSRGYYFAEPRELKADQIVKYSQDYSQANLHFSFNSGPQIYFRKMLILGNEQTKDIVIRREIHFQKGDLITPRDISLINERLRSLAIFSQVDVKPLRNTITEDNFLDVLIEVQEANFQTVEVAPGFRTDIGFKVSGSYNHYNLMDMNRGFTLEAEINRRTNFDGIASGRPKSDTHFLEYEADATYHEPYLFGRDLGYNASLSQSRKRFYSFDADISRLSNTLAKVFS